SSIFNWFSGFWFSSIFLGLNTQIYNFKFISFKTFISIVLNLNLNLLIDLHHGIFFGRIFY
ncbi:MAG: hypothetical protein ACK5D5_11600, partial [Bacteroidota bacterium]